MGSNLYNTSDFQKLSFGDNGLRVVITGGTTTPGESFGAIQVIDSAVISWRHRCNWRRCVSYERFVVCRHNYLW
jgi:hypothetical protein